MIRLVKRSDAQSICDIYNYYVQNTVVTFEEEAVLQAEMIKRIHEITEKYPWYVYETDGKIIGYAYASAWKSRCAYRYSVECTVYLQNNYTGKGIGKALYEALFSKLQQSNIHSIIGGIALPNESSIALHEKFGFAKVAHFQEVGYKFDKWIDVAYWEKVLK